MTEDELQEAISAFADGEALQAGNADEVVDALIARPQLRERWRRYEFIGEAMRGRALSEPPDMLADLHAAIAAEPAPIAAEPPPKRHIAWWRSPQRLAMAASLCAVAIVGAWWGLQSTDSNAGAGVSDTYVSVPLRIQRMTSPLAPQYGLTFNHANWNAGGADVEARLNNYLLNHNVYSARGMHGMLPYARVVAYEDGR